MTSDKQGKLVVLTIEEIQRQLSKANTELMLAETELKVKTCIEIISNTITHLKEYPKLGNKAHDLYQIVEAFKVGDKTRNELVVATKGLMDAIIVFINEEKERKARAEKVKQALLVMAENIDLVMEFIDKKK